MCVCVIVCGCSGGWVIIGMICVAVQVIKQWSGCRFQYDREIVDFKDLSSFHRGILWTHEYGDSSPPES